MFWKQKAEPKETNNKKKRWNNIIRLSISRFAAAAVVVAVWLSWDEQTQPIRTEREKNGVIIKSKERKNGNSFHRGHQFNRNKSKMH